MSSKQQQIPIIRFKGFTDAWEQRKASDIFKSVSDKNHPELPVLSASQEKGMVPRDNIGIDIKYDKKSIGTYKRVTPGQFVIHLRSFQGGFAYSPIEGITSPAYTILDFQKMDEHDSLFWRSVLTSRDFIKRLETVTYGIRDGRSISYSDFSTLAFNVSSIIEQEKIGIFFKKVDNTIALHMRQLDNYKELKKAMMQKIFTQELRFKDQDGNDYPKWEIKKTSEIFQPYSEKNAANLPILSATQDRGLVYRDEVGIDIKYNKDSLYSYKIVRINDFVISLRSFQGGFELSDKEGIVSPAYTIFNKSNQEIYEIYFKHFFKTEHFINRLNTLVYGIRDGKSISFKEFSELKLNVPCYEEQQKIGDFLSSLDSKIEKVTEKIHWLNEQKKWFMQQMFV